MGRDGLFAGILPICRSRNGFAAAPRTSVTKTVEKKTMKKKFRTQRRKNVKVPQFNQNTSLGN
jgi:hypothetical protein